MLNKTIWLLWLQGWNDDIPWLVKQAAESWKINNPCWNIEHVTLENLCRYVNDIDYIYDKDKEISPQHKADIIRLALLKNHGGVWADATMLCMQPLDVWVQEAVDPAGLWMYHGHGCGMSCRNGSSIWFIVSQKESLLIRKWKAACDNYWKDRTNADSYLWLDKLFKELFESDIEFRKQWALAPYLYCELRSQAHSMAYRNGMTSDNRDLKKIFRDRPPYALKFWWKDWRNTFSDIDSLECKNSNGYYAIQMSKRRFLFKHNMARKGSMTFYLKTSMFDLKYFLIRKFKLLFKPFKPVIVEFFRVLQTSFRND